MTAPTQAGQHVRLLPAARTPFPDARVPRRMGIRNVYTVSRVERGFSGTGPMVYLRGETARGFFAWRFEVVNPDCPTTIRKLGLPT